MEQTLSPPSSFPVVPVMVYVRAIKHGAKPESMQEGERSVHQTQHVGTPLKRGGAHERSRDI